jgi:chemotaxis signal transduction protein
LKDYILSKKQSHQTGTVVAQVESRQKNINLMNTMIQQSALIETMTGLVIFEIGGREFCADIKHISAIINPAELKQDENIYAAENPYIRINNIDIAVIALQKYFDVEMKKGNEDRRILIVEPDDVLFGFFVERVKEIFTMSREFKDKLTFSPGKEDEYLTGILHYEGRSLFMPDFNKIIPDDKSSQFPG